MDKIKIYTILLIFSCLFMACSNSDKPTVIRNGTEEIVLIFKSPPSRWREYRKDNDGYRPTQSEIQFIDDNFITKLFIPNPDLEADTLIVKTKRDFVAFRHLYKAHDKLSYIFQNGDTVIFTYKDKTPVAKVINRTPRTLDTNFDLYKRETFTPNDYPAYFKYRNSNFFWKSTKNFKGWDEYLKEDERVKSSEKEKFSIELKQEREFLDSLNQNNLISKEIYYYFITQTYYQQKIIQLEDFFGHSSKELLLKTLTADDFKIQLGYNQELGFMNSMNILDSKNDSLQYFGFHKDIIYLIYDKYLSRKVERIKTTNYVNNIATAGGISPDYLALYDTVYESKLLSPLTKKMFGFSIIQRIIENNTIDESALALSKFEKDAADTSLINFIKNKYVLEQDTMSNTYDLVLSSIQSEQFSFNKLIEKHIGNVIYMDFWSSGCPPCIKQFKFSDRLHDLYKDENLVQIYISVEPDKKMWMKACDKYHLETESYFIENRYTSRQLENMNIKYVPHYIIFDKKGNLVNDFAPRPSEYDSLTQLIDKYLKDSN